MITAFGFPPSTLAVENFCSGTRDFSCRMDAREGPVCYSYGKVLGLYYKLLKFCLFVLLLLVRS